MVNAKRLARQVPNLDITLSSTTLGARKRLRVRKNDLRRGIRILVLGSRKDPVLDTGIDSRADRCFEVGHTSAREPDLSPRHEQGKNVLLRSSDDPVQRKLNVHEDRRTVTRRSLRRERQP